MSGLHMICVGIQLNAKTRCTGLTSASLVWTIVHSALQFCVHIRLGQRRFQCETKPGLLLCLEIRQCTHIHFQEDPASSYSSSDTYDFANRYLPLC